jgi:asparagine synthase (glutamine-hydrolysing)
MNAVLPQYLTKGKTEKLRALLEEQPSLEAAYLSVRGLFLRKELSYNDTSQSPMKIPNEISTSLNYLRNLVNSCAESHSFNKISCLEIRSYLQNQLLRDTDVMGMAHALEIRAPFLDHRVVEFMAQVPVSLKTGKLPKAFLLRAIDGNLPNESFKNPKRGFALPFDMWFKHEWKNYIKITLLENSLEIDNLNWQPAHTWQQFLNGKIHWSRIWAIIVLTEWLKRFSCQDTTLANKF